MRSIAFELLRRVSDDDAYANLLLPKLLADAKVDSRDAGFVQELAFGTIRSQLLYEKIIESASAREVKSIDPKALILILLGTHQLLGMRVPAHAAINETVNLAKAKTSKSVVGFINAVLRRVSEKTREDWIEKVVGSVDSTDERLSITHSHPLWIVRAFRAALESRGNGDSLERLLIANNTPAKVSVAALPGFVSVSDLAEFGTPGLASPLSVELSVPPGSAPLIQKGFARVQDQGSQLAVLALLEAKIENEDTGWLDVCAGPGGKAALMAAISIRKGVQFDANEISPHRAKLVQDTLSHLGEFKVSVMDGRQIGADGPRYSRVLLDAPCTGLGALRRRPESRWRKNSSDIAELSRLQRDLFRASWDALLPGGVLGYVTCSPHLSESTALISFAEGLLGDDLELLPANAILNQINPSLALDESFKTAQLWPHVNGTDAMFIALIRKKVNS